MKKNILLFLLFIFPNLLISQMQASHWLFGKKVHIEFPFGDSNPNLNLPPSKINSENTIVNQIEGSSSISDVNGNLLLYTNGVNVYNRFHEKININNTKGSLTSTQSSIFIPYPGKYNQYILFTINQFDLIAPRNDISGLDFGLYYYIIDLNKNNGHGELIIPNNNRLLRNTEQKLHATFHNNKKDIWVITHFEGNFYAYLVTKDGIQNPILSNSENYIDPKTYTSTSKGFLKISPLGNKIGFTQLNNTDLSTLESIFPYPNEMLNDGFKFYSFLRNNPEYPGQVSLYDFNNTTGLISNKNLFRFKINAYGLEFSPDGKFLYHQYNEYSSDSETPPINAILQSSTQNIDDYNTLISIEQPLNNFFLQLSVNGKIYNPVNSNELSVIDKPKNLVNTADYLFKDKKINNLSTLTMGGINFISDYLKEEIKILNTFDGLNACVNTELKFWVNNNENIITINWDFGNGVFSDEKIPSYTYTKPGVYNIICTINGIVFNKKIQIHDYINLPNYTIKACDTNNDGIVSYNLNKFISFLGENAAYLSFHKTKNDAELNINSIENLIIESTSNINSLWARIINIGGCISFTEIKFEINKSEIIDDEKNICLLYSNDTFILTKENIQSLYSEPIKIYSNSNDADAYKNEITTPLIINDTQETITLYIKAEKVTECDSLYKVIFNLNKPIIITLEDKFICPYEGEANYEIPFDSEISDISWRDEFNNTISKSNNISINDEGKYSVTIINKNGCQYTNNFQVKRSSILEFDYKIENSTLILKYPDNINNYSFSIDEGISWNSGNRYSNLPLGNYDLWIKELNNNECIVAKIKIFNNSLINFFSPNNDGKNDNWSINGFEKYKWIDIRIYNRLGKILINKTINNSNILWDGKVNNLIQPSGSYWYEITTSNNERYMGHLLLKSF